MKTVGAALLKDECMTLLDELGDEGVLITRGGQPIAWLVPCHERSSDVQIGCLKGKIVVQGDILSTGENWDAEP